MRMRVWIVAVALAVIAGCGFHTITPPGAAPMRYRDAVFDAVNTTSDVSFGSAVDQQGTIVDLKLDVYEPAGDTNTERPVIVWVHGGSFSGGDKTSGEIVFEATEMAKKGYVSVSISYRLYGPGCSAAGGNQGGCVQAIIDAQHDAQAAVRFLRQNAATYRIDTDRIAIGGTSAGAITALNVGANADDPGTSGNPGFSSAVGGAVSLSGAKLLGPPQTTGDAPTLMFHGTADPLVPYQWAVNTLNDAHAGGAHVLPHHLPGRGARALQPLRADHGADDELPVLGARPPARVCVTRGRRGDGASCGDGARRRRCRRNPWDRRSRRGRSGR